MNSYVRDMLKIDEEAPITPEKLYCQEESASDEVIHRYFQTIYVLMQYIINYYTGRPILPGASVGIIAPDDNLNEDPVDEDQGNLQNDDLSHR